MERAAAGDGGIALCFVCSLLFLSPVYIYTLVSGACTFLLPCPRHMQNMQCFCLHGAALFCPNNLLFLLLSTYLHTNMHGYGLFPVSRCEQCNIIYGNRAELPALEGREVIKNREKSNVSSTTAQCFRSTRHPATVGGTTAVRFH